MSVFVVCFFYYTVVNVLAPFLSLGADTVDSSAADQMYQQISEEPKVKKLYLRGSVQQ